MLSIRCAKHARCIVLFVQDKVDALQKSSLEYQKAVANLELGLVKTRIN